MGVLYARETPQDNFTPVSTMGVGIASQSQAGLMSVPDKVKLDGIDDEKLDGITDYIVDEGTDGIWTYRKWNSGIAECWGDKTTALNLSNNADYMYYQSSSGTMINFPTDLFVSAPIAQLQPTTTYVNITVAAISETGFTFNAFSPYRVPSNTTIHIYVYAIGTWK